MGFVDRKVCVCVLCDTWEIQKMLIYLEGYGLMARGLYRLTMFGVDLSRKMYWNPRWLNPKSSCLIWMEFSGGKERIPPRLWDPYTSVLEAKSYATASASDGTEANWIDQELAKCSVPLHDTSSTVDFASVFNTCCKCQSIYIVQTS